MSALWHSARMEQVEQVEAQPVGAVLKQKRECVGLSREELARAVGVSSSTIKAIELGNRKASPELAQKLDRVLGADSAAPVGSVLNCWIAPGFNALRLLGDLVAKVNGAGGSLEQSLLYLDHRSAADWCALIDTADYQQFGNASTYLRSARAVLRVTKDAPLDLICLGCGSARREVSLCNGMLEERSATDLRLYLLDISQPLLSEAYAYAAEALDRYPHASVTAVQGNFHDLPRYGALLYRPEHSHRRKIITMLGFTFGNLDNELRFVSDALAPFAKGDLLLLDVQRGYAAAGDASAIRRNDPGLQPGAQSARQRQIEAFFLGPLRRYREGGAPVVELRNELGPACVVPGSYQIEHVANVKDGAKSRRFVLAKARRYSIAELSLALGSIGWHLVEQVASGDDKRAPISQLLFERR